MVPAEAPAGLPFRTAPRHYDLSERLTAIVDIGGGSAEVILAAGGVIEQVVSLPLGAVRLSERYCKPDPLRRKDWKALRRGVDDALDQQMGKPACAAEVTSGSGASVPN